MAVMLLHILDLFLHYRETCAIYLSSTIDIWNATL